jgi:TonB family protein
MSWLHYLIEANIYLGVFYLCYCLFLNRDTHYMLGRVYLIFSCVVAFVLPVTQLSILKPVLPEMEIAALTTQASTIPVNAQQSKLAAPVQHFTFDDVVIYLYIAGAVIAFFVLLFRLRKLYILTRNNHSVYKDQYKLINLNDENTAFSFFNYLFIGSNVPQAETIIAHELVHIRQKHSVDIIFLEIMKIVNWFNPFIYLTQRSLKTIHEYIADEQTAAHEQDALAYSSFLLDNAYGIQGSSIAHSFFNYNLLKKRIIMLNKNRSGKLARLKYLAALPLCAGMLCASTLVFSKDYGFIDLAPRRVIKPAIDSTKYALKLTDLGNNLTQISDKIVHTNSKTGVETTYTVNSLTEKDKADLKEKGFDIIVVKREKAKADTGKKRLPPPALPKKVKADQVKFPPPTVVEIHKTPPPPPARPKVKDQIKFPPPVVKPDKPLNAQVNNMPPPPPPPFETVYEDFIEYVAKHTRYPAIARDNKVNGHIMLSVVINKEHKITDVKVEKGIGSGCDEEAVRAVSSYSNTINKAPGKYKMVVTYMLINEKDKKYYTPKPLGNEIDIRNFIGEVVVAGSVE